MLITAHGNRPDSALVHAGNLVVEALRTAGSNVPKFVFSVSGEAEFCDGAKPVTYIRVEGGKELLTDEIVSVAGNNIAEQTTGLLVGFFPNYRYFLSGVGEL